MSSSNADFLGLISAMGGESLVPQADAEDMHKGAAYIPSKVTEARRSNKVVKFVQSRPKSEWHWKMPDGSKIVYKE